MEIFQLLVDSKHGVAALATVSLAVTILISSLGALAYKARAGGFNSDPAKGG
jgi:hypothetical protein